MLSQSQHIACHRSNRYKWLLIPLSSEYHFRKYRKRRYVLGVRLYILCSDWLVRWLGIYLLHRCTVVSSIFVIILSSAAFSPAKNTRTLSNNTALTLGEGCHLRIPACEAKQCPKRKVSINPQSSLSSVNQCTPQPQMAINGAFPSNPHTVGVWGKSYPRPQRDPIETPQGQRHWNPTEIPSLDPTGAQGPHPWTPAIVVWLTNSSLSSVSQWRGMLILTNSSLSSVSQWRGMLMITSPSCRCRFSANNRLLTAFSILRPSALATLPSILQEEGIEYLGPYLGIKTNYRVGLYPRAHIQTWCPHLIQLAYDKPIDTSGNQ